MKRFIYTFIISILFTGIYHSSYAQESKILETEFRVDGVCKMCKTRIENAAYIKGVKTVEWNKDTQVIKVVYNSDKTNLDNIHTSIAAAGHSTDGIEADSNAYKKLPACCAYMDGVMVH